MTPSSTPQTQSLTERPAWKTLAAHHQQIRNLHLRQLFAGDPRHDERLTSEATPTASIRSISSSTREPGSCRAISSASASR
jgi:hypothetical protein